MFEIMKSKKRKRQHSKIVRSQDVPATVGHLTSMRDEILNTMNRRFAEQDERFLSFEQRFEGVDQRFAGIDLQFKTIDQQFKSIEQRFNEVDLRFEKIEQRFEEIDKKFEQLNEKIDAQKASLLAEMDRRFSRLEVLIYEQNSRNVFVLDGYNDLSARLKKVEVKVKDLPN